MNKISKFLKDVGAELQKVTWPSKQEIIGSTWVTIIVSVIVALFIGVVDQALTAIIKVIFDTGIGS